MTGRPRLLLVADADSYVKWGAALAGQVPEHWAVRLVVARSSAEPSGRQVAAALVGTPFEGDEPPRVGQADVRGLLTHWRPDVLVAATRGPAVQALVGLVDDRPDRPVIVSGLAGIAVPVIPFGLGFRRAVDLFVLHSRRELREFAVASRALGIPHRFALATLPFLGRPSAGASPPRRDRIVFAAQAMVPETRRERTWLLRRLADTARAHPHLTVVLKVRGETDEPQTHVDLLPYQRLLDDLAATGEHVPPNLVVAGGAMGHHLDRAVGLVTVSSTALLEAVSRDVPVLALTDFGIGAAQINEVLVGSGLLGTTDDLVRGTFRHPAPGWLDDNYFHDAAADSWVVEVERLLASRAAEGLPGLPRPGRSPVARARLAVYRRFAFVPERRGREFVVSGFLASILWMNRRRWQLRRLARDLRGRVVRGERTPVRR